MGDGRTKPRGCDHLRRGGILCQRPVVVRVVGPQLIVYARYGLAHTWSYAVADGLDLAYCEDHIPAALREAIQGRMAERPGR